jgi:metallo-beta-lactamase class B
VSLLRPTSSRALLLRAHRARVVAAFATVALLVSSSGSGRQASSAQPESPAPPQWPASWTEPQAPFRLLDNLYYVGSAELGSYLIATSDGLILLDTGSQEDAQLIRRGIATLGFDLGNLRILLNSQAHFDHTAGLAALKRASGAQLFAMEADADLLEAGGRGDFAFGDRFLFPAVSVDRRLRDKDTVELGGTRLTALHTPGHTRGCTTWLLTLEDNGRPVRVVFAGSTSINPGVRLAGPPSYPGIAEDFAKTHARLQALIPDTDVFLSAHAGFFSMADKLARREAGEQHVFFDRPGFADWVERSERRYLRALETDRGGQ